MERGGPPAYLFAPRLAKRRQQKYNNLIFGKLNRDKGEFPLQRTTIATIYANSQAMGGQQLTVAGWVRSLRDMKTFGFITLNDGRDVYKRQE